MKVLSTTEVSEGKIQIITRDSRTGGVNGLLRVEEVSHLDEPMWFIEVADRKVFITRDELRSVLQFCTKSLDFSQVL